MSFRALKWTDMKETPPNNFREILLNNNYNAVQNEKKDFNCFVDLVITDTNILNSIIKNYLTKLGRQCEIIDINNCIDVLQKNKYSVVWIYPKNSILYENIKKIYKGTIIGITNCVDNESIKIHLKYGINDILLMPFTELQMKEIIKKNC